MPLKQKFVHYIKYPISRLGVSHGIKPLPNMVWDNCVDYHSLWLLFETTFCMVLIKENDIAVAVVI